jgi:SAM-dependent methyltransferase
MSKPNQALAFYLQLEAEVSENHDGLDPSCYDCLSRYYTSLKSNFRLRPFYRYNWTRRIAPMQKVIAALPRRDTPWRILDAGCGVGTESIFWSTLRDDMEVTGVDINTERLNIAKARQTAYENRLGKPFNIRFLEQDVFNVLRVEHFDLIWVMEAISDIDPAESFLTCVSENLGSAGYLVISDSHILNPAMAWRIYKLRQRGVAAHTYKTTSTGETISYARERLFTVGQLSKMLEWAGFQSVQTQLSIFFPPAVAYSSFLFRVCVKCDYVLNKIPLLRHLGGIYTVVASK